MFFTGNKTIQIENIINVKTQLNFVPVTNGFQQSNGPSIPSPSTNTNNDLSLDQLSFKNITINYAKQVSGAKNVNKWRIRSITFNNSDKRIIREWYESLTVILKCEYDVTVNDIDLIFLPFRLLLFFFLTQLISHVNMCSMSICTQFPYFFIIYFQHLLDRKSCWFL